MAGLSALMAAQVTLTSGDGDPARVAALRVSHDLLPMLGIDPIAGRGFTPQDDVPRAADTAIVSESLARRIAGNAAAAVAGACCTTAIRRERRRSC